MRLRAVTQTGAVLQAVVWVAGAALTAGELALARCFPQALWPALVADLLLVSPLLLGRQAWYLCLVRPAAHTQEYCPVTGRSLWRSVFSCLRATYARQWGVSIAWRWGWWWRCAAITAVSLLPATLALALSFLTATDGVLAIGLRLALQVGAAVAAVVGVIVALWWMTGYYPAVYLIASGETVGAAFSASRRMMNGYEGRWLAVILHNAWRFLVSWLPVGGWYAMPQVYAELITLAAQCKAKTKKV